MLVLSKCVYFYIFGKSYFHPKPKSKIICLECKKYVMDAYHQA